MTLICWNKPNLFPTFDPAISLYFAPVTGHFLAVMSVTDIFITIVKKNVD